MFFPETARERDLQRYYQPWLDARTVVLIPESKTSSSGLTYKGYRPKASRDKALTAFAQLAALRLGVRRAMISLIDSKLQYILAEATKSLSLVEESRHQRGDALWLGNTIISRTDGVCYHSFTSTYTATDEEGNIYTTEALVVPDLREDDRFKELPFITDPGVLFYAGVPIRTQAGHKIGVYAVSSDQPRFGLTIDEVKFMQDVALTIMEHLEYAKDRDDRNKGERMVRGLAEFIEGMSLDEPSPKLDGTSHRLSTLDKQTENAKIEDTDTPVLPPRPLTNAVHPTETPGPRKEWKSQNNEDDTVRIFNRAARIIRDSTLADGVVFFATLAGGMKLSFADSYTGEMSDDSQASDNGFLSGSQRSTSVKGLSQKSSRTSLRNICENSTCLINENTSSSAMNEKTCDLIGSSMLDLSTNDYSVPEPKFNFTDRKMERYFRRYPHGKFFNFSEQGTGITSSDEKSESEQCGPSQPPLNAGKRRARRKNEFVPTEILAVLPGIRSLIFLPIWDPTVDKWIAAGFIWTATAGRLMSPDNELPYLKAFGNSIISEVTHMNAQKSDRAKTTFIASVSHELRSPLHGILGSVEFLSDTSTSSYQANLVSSIEKCGKTLLDTIDHVLDYAKINRFRKTQTRKRNDRGSVGNSSVLGISAEVDLCALVEEAVDAVCAGQAFKKAGSGFFSESSSSKAVLERWIPNAQGEAGFGNPPSHPNRVDVLLDIAPILRHRMIRTQPGAVRRIVMNLLGNSLKYTPSGFVAVSLQPGDEMPSGSRMSIKLRFIDSGKGMSLEYQRTKLFAPFSQEDPFAVGTGLGLSIVRQIVESLGGTINLNSTKGVGTEIEVAISFPSLPERLVEVTDNSIATVQASTKGLKACILRSGAQEDLLADDKYDRLATSIGELCIRWFGMNVEYSGSEDCADADIYICLDTLPGETLLASYYSGTNVTPLVIVSPNTTYEVVLRQDAERRFARLGVIFQIISQPCGPRKLVMAFQHCLCSLRPTEPMPMQTLDTEETDTALNGGEPEPPKSMIDITVQHGKDRGRKDSLSLLPVKGCPTVGLSKSFIRRSSTSMMPTPSDGPEMLKVQHGQNTHITSAPKNVSCTNSNVREGQHTPRILCVDDNKINLKLLVMFMKKLDYPYAEARNGLEAFEMYRSSNRSSSSSCSDSNRSPSPASSSSSISTSMLDPYQCSPTKPSRSRRSPPSRPKRSIYDIILMDISMPVMDGLEATRRIRTYESKNRWKRAKIIALTGLAIEQAQEEAMGSGVDLYLTKPVKFADLARILKT